MKKAKRKEPLNVSLLRKLVQVRAENEALKATIADTTIADTTIEEYKDYVVELVKELEYFNRYQKKTR